MSNTSAVKRTAAALLAVTLAIAPVEAQQAVDEYQVKAAFLFNFGRFVEWPADSQQGRGDSFLICVLGEDPFGAMLDEMIEDKSVHGKSIRLLRLTDAGDATACHVLFVSSSEGDREAGILNKLRGQSVLTVGERPGFTERGGVVNFQVEGKRVRFEINVEAATHAGLEVSAQLLKVAKVVGKPSRRRG